ncbi:MAG: methyltransferase domain-containing protein [Candidatus Caldarchaeum sp.]
MNVVEELKQAELTGRVLFIGDAEAAVMTAEKLGLSEVYVADDDWAKLEKVASAQKSVKVVPVYTRVIERLVELPSQSFDVIVSLNGLEKALNKPGFMTEALRLLKEGGTLVILTRLRTFFHKTGIKKDLLEKLLGTRGYRQQSVKKGGGRVFAVLVKSSSQ